MLWRVEYEDHENYDNSFTEGIYSTLEKAQEEIRQVLLRVDSKMFFRYYAESVQNFINNLVIVPQPIDNEKIESDHRLAADEATAMIMHEMKDLYAEAYDCEPKDYGHYIIEVERNK